MEKKIFLLISLTLLISIFSISSVMAADINNTASYSSINQDINNTNINQEISANSINTITESQDINESTNNYKLGTSNGTTYIVDGSSKNQMDNPTIQDTINKANAGDTILITGTSYVHCHIIVNKQLNIISNCGTTMSTCPSNTQGSNGLGIFYFTSEASNSVLSGFTLINEVESGNIVDPYGIYINGGNNILITNCTVSSTNGQAILIKGAKNTTISNSNIKNSIKGIILENSDSTLIKNNYIHENTLNGISLDEGVSQTTIDMNNITANLYGINASTADNVKILNNKIFYNRNIQDQSRATMGAGIYVNNNITNMLIRGNFIYENGMYGIFNDYRVRNLINQNIQIVDQNFFGFHKQRAVFTAVYTKSNNGDYDYNATTDTYTYVGDGNGHYTTGTGQIFIWSNIYYGELFCGSTSYAPGELRSANPYKDLIVGNITQVSNGVYSFSFVYKNNGSVATDFNSVEMTFFLNKNNTATSPVTGDIYSITEIHNGTAVVDFRNASFLKTGNNVTVIGPGMGSLDGGNRPYAFYNVNDSDIPTNKSIDTILTANDFKEIYGAGQNFTGKLTDNQGNPIIGQHIALKLTNPQTGANKIYWQTTDNNGEYQLEINLYPGVYTVAASYDGITKGDITYLPSGPINATISVTKESNKTNTILTANDFKEIYGAGQNFTGKLTDNQGNPIIGQHIALKLTNPQTGANKIYWQTTDNNGEYQLEINLYPGVYTAECSFGETSQYVDSSASATINVITTSQKKTKLIGSDLNSIKGSYYNVLLIDNDTNALVNQELLITFYNGNQSISYTLYTNEKGVSEIQINFNPGNYTVKVEYLGNEKYAPCETTNKIIINKNNILYIPQNISNDEIQKLIDSNNESNILFLGENYNKISLIINKPLNITTNINTTLNGINGSEIFLITKSGMNSNISNFNFISYEGTGIKIENTSNIKLSNNSIKNILDSEYKTEYAKGLKIMPGNGVGILNSSNIVLEYNTISSYENGVYLNNSQNIFVNNNILKENNYGINYDYNVSNTKVFNNTINENVGNYTLEVPEGPLGYGIYLNNSGVNASIINNSIINNYIGILIDSNYSTGITITKNLICENALEGITFWKHYDLAENAIYPVVTDNAIYNNAKGPSMMILGEMSANPEGIYGPGQWNDSLKLVIGANWYGTNHLVTWDLNGTVGAGTMCPRIKTTPITFNITCTKPGTYNVNFYKNNTLDTNLPTFTLFFTLNVNGTETEIEITNGTGTITFNPSEYKSSDNIIEVSAGSLKSTERIYYVIEKYNVPNNEIPSY
ncbi:right-handed parallel beta-helix repeat-containing protein [Methanobrevibacter acididurans]|uniref:right-handed parallel beta-helix repeat-containing protein n=1 Tax=Methanobrevibacter acididurans TaxID=120963 RepID=UPI0038FC6921